MITFSIPVDLADLQELLDNNGAELVSYQAKFINGAGNWATFGGTIMNEERMIQLANETAEGFGSYHSSYEGIVCAEIRFPKNISTYNSIQNAQNVYFLDISKALWYANNENNENIRPVVPSYAWDLAQFTNQEG